MTVELSGTLEQNLRTLAASQGRDIGCLVEGASQEPLGAVAITDLDAEQLAETQVAPVGELHGP